MSEKWVCVLRICWAVGPRWMLCTKGRHHAHQLKSPCVTQTQTAPITAEFRILFGFERWVFRNVSKIGLLPCQPQTTIQPDFISTSVNLGPQRPINTHPQRKFQFHRLCTFRRLINLQLSSKSLRTWTRNRTQTLWRKGRDSYASNEGYERSEAPHKGALRKQDNRVLSKWLLYRGDLGEVQYLFRPKLHQRTDAQRGSSSATAVLRTIHSFGETRWAWPTEIIPRALTLPALSDTKRLVSSHPSNANTGIPRMDECTYDYRNCVPFTPPSLQVVSQNHLRILSNSTSFLQPNLTPTLPFVHYDATMLPLADQQRPQHHLLCAHSPVTCKKGVWWNCCKEIDTVKPAGE